MQADAQTTTTQSATPRALVADAVRAVANAEKGRSATTVAAAPQSVDPVPALATASASLAVRRFTEAKQSRQKVQSSWKHRPKSWTPFATWAEAEKAWCAARQAWTNAFTESRRHTTPFVQGADTDPVARDIFVFSRTIEEAVVRTSKLPSELVAACRAEQKAKDHMAAVRRRAIQTPAAGLDIVVKLRLITEEIDDVFDPLEQQDVKEAHKRSDEFPQANEFFALHDDIVRTTVASDEMLALTKELASRTLLEMAAQSDEEIDEAIEYSAVAANEIMARPAVTLADFRAKAEAVKWACDGREGLDEQFANASGSTFMKFAHQVICELLDVAAPTEGSTLQ